MDSFERLNTLASRQKSNTAFVWKKIGQFIKFALLNYENPFEQYVLQNEPNDCALLSKYGKTVHVDLSNTSISVDEVYLRALHIQHPLLNFMKNENNKTVDILKHLKESPILVFVHGFGGQMSQFEPLMALLSQCLEIISLDLPGFGDSRLEFNSNCTLSHISVQDQQRISQSIKNMAHDDFSSDSIATIVVEFIKQTTPPNKKIVLVGHSMGCNIATRVAQKLPTNSVEGLILLSPATFIDDINDNYKPQSSHWSLLATLSKLGHLVSFPLFLNYFRIWDRLEGLYSASVVRQLGDISQNHPNTNLYIKLRQLRWNLDINTSIILKYAKGYQKCKYSDLVAAIKKFNNNPFDSKVYEKTLIVCGTKDSVSSIEECAKLHRMLSHSFQRKVSCLLEINNAGHALLLSKPEFVSGKILDHIEHKFPERLHLSPAWVLRWKADISGDKWGLKNELKWLQTAPVSGNIARNNGTDIAPLLGMKTLREGDTYHSPQVLEATFYHQPQAPVANDVSSATIPSGKIIAVIDISADTPPYNPETFQIIQYHKCATISKVVPDPSSVRKFIQLVDSILEGNTTPNPLIAVHCHYGFNRTGYLICCYLVEKLGWSVTDAIDGFKAAKPPGIKHPHFIDALYVRYES